MAGFGSLAMDGMDPLTGAVVPSEAHQAKFGRIADAVFGGLRGWIETPGRAMQQGITTDQAVDWAAPTALGMIAGARMPGGAPEGVLGSSGSKLVQPEGIRAYHGSPHDFDRFSMEHIGKGEGAQAYGHGLYFAESEPVARSYRDSLARQSVKSPSGKTITPAWHDPEYNAVQYFNQAGGDIDKALALAKAGKSDNLSWTSDIEKVLEGYRGAGMQPNPPGRMYEVNISARPEQFLDYDLPIAQQSPNIREVFDRFGYVPKDAPPFMLNDAANQLAAKDGSWSTAAGGRNVSEKLREAGVPGIRYLDQGSRVPGAGTSNYVVFDDSLVNILRKYGLAGLGATAAAGASRGTFGSLVTE